MNKELIKKRFGRKLSSYNNNAHIQKQMAEKLVSMLDKQDNKTILEIGCGTGILTQLAVKNLSCETYTALDIVPDCEKFIKEISPDIEFLPYDIEEYIEQNDKKYDLIISNASLQWVENLPEFTEKLTEKLNPEGTLLFTTFGVENFREIYYVLGKTLHYFSVKELEEQLKKYNPLIEEEIRIMAFKTPKDVLKHIQNTGVNALSTESWTKRDLVNFEKEYNVFCSNRPVLTYHPVYIRIKNRLVG